MAFESRNPANGEVFAAYEGSDKDQIDRALEQAVTAVGTLARLGFKGRAERMRRAGDIMENEAGELAKLMSREMGKPVAQARAEAEKCAWVCRYYADNAEDFLKDEPIEAGDKGRCALRYLPLGPVLAIMPWNFPFWQVFRFAAPNLMAGNPGLLKHASNVPGCAKAIEDVFKRAGFEPGSFTSLLIDGKTASGLVGDARIRGVTLTGSEGAGRKVGEAAGQAIKPCVLELGGSDAFVVMPSADLEAAAKVGVKARIQNNGQSCIAAKRFIVHEDVYEAFKDRFVEELKAQTVGDPLDEDTDIGPLVGPDAAEELDAQVRDTIKAGARAVVEPGRREGAWFTPGVLEDIPEDSPGYKDELFGPVALFFKVGDLEQAIHLANDHRYGLGSSFWSKDEGEIEEACNRIEAGSTYVNQMVASDPRLPFGGVKASGHGRELARAGILEFTNRKTIAVKE